MPNLTLSGNTYFSYVTVAEADNYLIPDPSYAIWSALTTDQKTGFLITATRFIDSLEYIPSADTQAERELIEAFSTATILIASLAASGNTSIFGSTVAEAAAKRYKAGSVELEYFRDISSFFASVYSNWPANILALLRPYLLSFAGGGIGGAKSFGTCGISSIRDYGLNNVT